jgi:CRP/FNR family transcriptional regulator
MQRHPHPRALPLRVELNCFECQSRERSTWCGLSEADLRLLNQHKQCAEYRAGQVVFRQGDPFRGVFVIEQGTLALRKCDRFGNTILLTLAHGGDTVGYRDYLAEQDYSTSADVLTDARLCLIAPTAVRELLRRNPALGLRFVRRMAEDLETAEQGMLRVSSMPIRARVAHLLLTLKDRYGTADDTGVLRVELPLSRQDMASLLGVRPETITRTLHALEEAGVATFAGRTASIPDLDLLLNEVEFPENE